MPAAVARRWFRHLSPVGQRISAATHRARSAVPGFARHLAAPSPGYTHIRDREIANTRLLSVMPARADAAANRRAVIAALLEHFGRWGTYQDGWIAVGYGRLADRASQIAGRRISRSCAASHVRAMVAAGLLHIAMRGCSRLVNGTDRDWCPIYTVTEPAPDADEEALAPEHQALIDRLRTAIGMKPLARPETGSHPVGVVNYEDLVGAQGHLRGIKPSRQRPQRIDHVEKFTPRTSRERALSYAWLAGQLGLDLHTHAGTLAKATYAFYRAGWTPEAVYWAIRYAPDGTAHQSPVTDADRPARALNWRLSRWRDTTRRPLPPPTSAATPARGRPPAPHPARVAAEAAYDARDPRKLYDNTLTAGARAAIAAMRALRRPASPFGPG